MLLLLLALVPLPFAHPGLSPPPSAAPQPGGAPAGVVRNRAGSGGLVLVDLLGGTGAEAALAVDTVAREWGANVLRWRPDSGSGAVGPALAAAGALGSVAVVVAPGPAGLAALAQADRPAGAPEAPRVVAVALEGAGLVSSSWGGALQDALTESALGRLLAPRLAPLRHRRVARCRGLLPSSVPVALRAPPGAPSWGGPCAALGAAARGPELRPLLRGLLLAAVGPSPRAQAAAARARSGAP